MSSTTTRTHSQKAITITFVKEIPEWKVGRPSLLNSLREQMKARPNEWAILFEDVPRHKATATRAALGADFEVAGRTVEGKHNVYGRFTAGKASK